VEQIVRVALAQVAPALGNVAANLAMHRKQVESARRARADLVVFPELSLTGYLLQDLVSDVARSVGRSREVKQLLGWSRRIGIVAGLVEESDDHRFFNTAVFLAGGRFLHRHRKVYLPTYGMFDEGRYFAPGDSFAAFDTPLGRFGILICEDAWHLSASYLLARDGADYLLILSSGPGRGVGSGRELSSLASWTELCRVLARFTTVYVVYVNRVGVEDGMHFSGGSFVADPAGNRIGGAPALREDLLVVDLPRSALRRARTRIPLLRDERGDLVLRELVRLERFPATLGGAPATRAASPARRPPLARGRLG
jgi:predicted amidohydrolase